MIQLIKRADLDVEKYNSCIENSIQQKIYGFSWYLDCVTENWSVLMANDYDAVMPLPYNKKFGINYIYPPFWVLELGVFSKTKEDYQEQFISFLKKQFRWVEIRCNEFNQWNSKNPQFLKKQFQTLDLTKDYQKIHKQYRSDRKKDLKKAKKNKLTIKWNDQPEQLISLFSKNIGVRTPNIKSKHYSSLKQLIKICYKKQKGIILSIYDGHQLVASCFLILYKKTVTILISATDLQNRNNGANTFMIDEIIRTFVTEYQQLNFGGSSIASVAAYFLSFGAVTHNYPFLKINKLPLIYRLFKN